MTMHSSPAWSLYGRHPQKDAFKAPGPGNYDPKETEGSPNTKFGSSKRDDMVHGITTPGPGTYAIADKSTLTSSPIFFGTGKRPDLAAPTPNPGPGTYAIKPKVGEGPQYSFKLKLNSRKKDEVPGPGHYEPKLSDQVYEKSPHYRIGTAQRNGDVHSQSPGPGTYDSRNKTDGPQWGFGSETRDSMRKSLQKNEIPGPGAYKVEGIKDPRAFSMSPRHKHQNRERSPGPGTYSPSLRGDTPLFSIGKGPRDTRRNVSEVPGPGTYQSRTWTEDFAYAIRFGTGNRRPLSAISHAPGPGAYFTRGKTGEGPSFSMRSRTAKIKHSEVPGPGTYQPTLTEFVYETSPKSKFGASKRSSMEHTGNPVGPGMYDVRGNFIGPKWGFGTSKRSELRKKSEVPGPGTYSVKATVPDVPYYARS